jgi:hypothetical protein
MTMPDMISTIPGDMGSGGGPTLPTADQTPQPGPDTGGGTPQGDPKSLPSADDKGDPGKGGAPALAGDTPPAGPKAEPSPAPAPVTPAGPSPEVQALNGKVEQLTNLLGTLLNQTAQPAAPASPARDFAGEKAALDDALKAEKIDTPTYMAKVGQLAMDQAEAKALAASSQGNATTVQQVQAELKQAQDKASWQALCAENEGLDKFAASPEFAKIKAANPLHDPLSAYYVNQLALAKAATDTAVKEAVAAKEKEMVAAIKAKGNAAVLGNPGGQAPQGGQDFDAMLKNPEKYGGLAAVQAAKLKHLRAGA